MGSGLSPWCFLYWVVLSAFDIGLFIRRCGMMWVVFSMGCWNGWNVRMVCFGSLFDQPAGLCSKEGSLRFQGLKQGTMQRRRTGEEWGT